MHPYSNMDTATAWKISHSILLDRIDFHRSDILSMAFYIFAWHILTSLSVDEILQPRYVNWSTNFKDLPLRVEMALFV